MAVKTTLSEIAHGALGSSFLKAIKVMYQQAVEDGVFQTVESEYEEGVCVLNEVFSSEKTDQLAEYEHTCSNIRDYSARYGFLAGMYCGFKQYFTPEVEDDGGFLKYVNDEIGRMPRMKRHKEYSVDGFYLGYRAAIAILETVEPQNWPALAMERNLLMMEHRLGFIKSYEEIERNKERNLA